MGVMEVFDRVRIVVVIVVVMVVIEVGGVGLPHVALTERQARVTLVFVLVVEFVESAANGSIVVAHRTGRSRLALRTSFGRASFRAATFGRSPFRCATATAAATTASAWALFVGIRARRPFGTFILRAFRCEADFVELRPFG